jgi:cytochrome P450
MSQDQDVATAAGGDVTAGELLPDFDFFDPSHAPRADDVLRYARERCPVPHTTATGGYYIATTYDTATRVLGDQATFSSHEYVNIAGGGVILPPIDADPPAHFDFRRLLNPFFHPKYLARSEDEGCIGIHLARMQVRVALTELLDRVTRIRLAPGASLDRRPGISKVLRELRIEFDQR